MTTIKFSSLTLLALLLALALITDSDGYIFIIDDANLAFHEAGHIFFGLFGNTVSLYGGTLGQLVFPIVTAIVFFRQGAMASCAVSLLWFFENFFNIARYMADARTQILPLVGGGDHDWTNIFSRWGLLGHDVTISNITRILGWLGIILTIFFVFHQWNQARKA